MVGPQAASVSGRRPCPPANTARQLFLFKIQYFLSICTLFYTSRSVAQGAPLQKIRPNHHIAIHVYPLFPGVLRRLGPACRAGTRRPSGWPWFGTAGMTTLGKPQPWLEVSHSKPVSLTRAPGIDRMGSWYHDISRAAEGKSRWPVNHGKNYS